METTVAQVVMFSPLTVYSTLPAPNGKIYLFLLPFEERFNELVKENLLKTYSRSRRTTPFRGVFYQPAEDKRRRFQNNPLPGNHRQRLMGEYELCGDPPLQIALDAGLGAKNSRVMGAAY